MRLPEKGSKVQTLRLMDTNKAWLAPLHGKEAQPASAYKGNPKEAVWLPNEAVAKAWMDYVQTGAVGDTTPPPAPFNVGVRQKGNEGVEIVWDADADFESGRLYQTGLVTRRVPTKGFRDASYIAFSFPKLLGAVNVPFLFSSNPCKSLLLSPIISVILMAWPDACRHIGSPATAFD